MPLTTTRPSYPPRSRPGSRPGGGRLSELVRRPAVGAGAVALVLVAGGTAAATDVFQVFRTEEVRPVELRADDLATLPDLRGLGEVTTAHEPALRTVDDAAAATGATGLAVPVVTDLPGGVAGEPTYEVADAARASVTFDAGTAARAGLPTMPAALDGADVQIAAGPGIAQLWTGPQGTPRLVVGTALAPTISSPEVDLDQARDYVLSLPGFPRNLADQVEDLDADDGTLPLPVPADLVESTTADIGGVTATVLETADRALSAVVWVEDGVVTLVAGAYAGEELVTVARDLR